MAPDPRPPRRVRDTELLRVLHAQWRGDCALADLGDCDESRYSLHHIHRHPRDDVQANLVMLCGDGVRGHHGRIEHHHYPTCRELAAYLMRERLDVIGYLGAKLGGVDPVREWLRSQLHYKPLVAAPLPRQSWWT